MEVFLSYSSEDRFFADLLEIKLAEANIKLWRDKGSLVSGTEWRQGIEAGISKSTAVLIALSESSSKSAYVTYEWAYAIGKGKTVIPIKIEECNIHPRLEVIHYLDFSSGNALPWELLIERIKGVELVAEQTGAKSKNTAGKLSTEDREYVKEILNYLDQRGYQTVSYERLRNKIDESLSDAKIDALVEANRTLFRKITLKRDKKGLAKIIP